MTINRAGRLSADISSADGTVEFRVTDGLYYYEVLGMPWFAANDGQGKEFYVHLPEGIQSGSHSLSLYEHGPKIIHVTGNCEAELFPGMLELTVGGDAQFSGSFRGTDADGLQVSGGSFRLEREASA